MGFLVLVGLGAGLAWTARQDAARDVLPEPHFHFISPWEAARIPRAERFSLPLGSENGALVYNAQKFWDMNAQRGNHHLGDDLNGIGGMNTDLGDPVRSVADGLVIYAGNPAPSWGNIVVIGHITREGARLQSMYAHMHTVQVAVGKLIARGQVIGTLGTANGYYPAHLHFEMRASDCLDIGAGYGLDPLNRVDPIATILSLRGTVASDLASSPLATALRE